MRILFITSNRIGDAVLSTGVLARLLERHPGARVTVACGPAPAELFTEVPGLERIIPMAKKPRSGHWLALWRATALTVWGLVVDLRASAFAYAVPARRRLVFRPSKEPLHRVAQLGRLLGEEPPPDPRVWTGERHRRAAASLIAGEGPVLAVGPTANWGGKQWRPERFIAAIARLTAADGVLPGSRVAVFGAAHERDMAQPVLDAIPEERRIDLVGRADLLTVHACLERCTFYLGNDSGLMHLASAAGIPTLGLFGPSPEVHYGPWGGCAAAVRGDQSFEDIVAAPDYDYRSQETRMDGLSVDRVVAAAEALWRRCGGRR